jgi:hypothetical protein
MVCLRDCLANKTRLADARLPDDQHGATVTGGGCAEQVGEEAQLCMASDEGRTQDDSRRRLHSNIPAVHVLFLYPIM